MSIKTVNPTITDAKKLAKHYYGIKVEAKKLQGEEDHNFYLKCKSGKESLLKISTPNTDPDSIAFQAAVMNHLEKTDFPLDFPKVVKTQNNDDFVSLNDRTFVRMQSWVPGKMVAEVNPRTRNFLKEWGKTVGLVSKALQGFDHADAHRFYKWNPSETLHSKQYLHYMSLEEKEMANYFWNLFQTKAQPILPNLRKSVNYNDAHELNLLVDYNLKAPKITGVIDFGDALYCETINELAIACAYAGMGMADPLEAFSDVVKAYHEVFSLKENELTVLFPMIGARLMITVASAARNKFLEPDNPYLVISEKPAWDLLKKLKAIPTDFAHYRFREACGLEPHPKGKKLKSWLAQKENDFHPIFAFENQSLGAIDLSVGSLSLGNNSNYETIKKFEKTIENILEEKELHFGLGGYGETRPFYTTDAYQTEGNNGAEWRTVHLGLDVWIKEGTPVYAPLAGKIHSLQNNKGDCNYGPTIILEHHTEEQTFYTLYGHLSLGSLVGKKPGDSLAAGQQIGSIGMAQINGGWPPHLHFQLILDLLGNKGDFPGVAYPKDQKTWLSICPDPSSFFPDFRKEKEVQTKESILEIRDQHLGGSLSLSYQNPLHIVRAYKQYLYDTNGRRYLDTANNVPHVGHQHPKVVKAAQKQLGLLNTNTRYIHQNITDYAKALLNTFPKELSVVHFVNSGSEANELAIRMAEAYTQQKDIIAIEVGYHGNTGRCIDVSSYKFDGKGGNGAPDHTHLIPLPGTFRGKYRDPQTAGKKYAEHLIPVLENLKKKGRNIAGFLCESIISCGGQIVLPKGFLAEAYQLIRQAGGLCIADEVQVGFGRVGSHFWGFELQEVVPDIVTLGKPIGNGHPLAAVVTKRKVANAFANGMEFFNTFGGNPVSCAIGLEVLNVIQEENLQENASKVGQYLQEKLKVLQTEFPIIGDVRGSGFFLGFELVKDLKSLSPAPEQTSYLANRMKERGILMSTDGPYHNVIKIKPPMCFTKENVAFLIHNLRMVFKENFMQI